MGGLGFDCFGLGGVMESVIFYYTGVDFWAIIGLLLGVSILVMWFYVLLMFKTWTHRRRYIVMLSTIGFSEESDKRVKFFMSGYNEVQRRLIYAFIDRLKYADFEASNEEFHDNLDKWGRE